MRESVGCRVIERQWSGPDTSLGWYLKDLKDSWTFRLPKESVAHVWYSGQEG
jgi:hypothetical protein